MRGYKCLKRFNNKGFTLVEMMVVIAIMAIVLAASAWGVTGWILHSEFIKNEGNAQTVYLAAQSALSNAASRGAVDSVINNITLEAEANGGDIAPELKASYGLPDENDNELQGHKYVYLTVAGGSYTSGADSMIFKLIKPYIFDEASLDGAITIEFDVTSKTVYSVFYSAWAKTMEYGGGAITARDTFYINSANRSESVRSGVAMGYYAVDQVNVAILDAETLRLTDVSLNNEETLNLRFGSSSKHNDLDTVYTLDFYEQDKDSSSKTTDDSHFLFSTTIDYSKIVTTGESYKASDGKLTRRVKLDLTLGTGSSQTTTKLPFILSYNGSNYELVLDAVNTSQSYAALGLDSDQLYSITRILKSDPVYIFAEVSVSPTADALNMREYSVSSNRKLSNTENDMFASNLEAASGDGEYTVKADGINRISEFRHLSNIRFRDKNNKYEFTSDLDWNDNVVYSVISESGAAKAVDAATAVFPTVPELKTGSNLDGNGCIINNLRLSEKSSVEYASKATDSSVVLNNIASSVGLFGTNSGDISSLVISNANLTVGSGEATSSTNTSIYNNTLKSIGILAGVNAGSIKEIYFDSGCNLYADILYNADGHKAASADGIGMLTGAMDVTKTNQVDRILTDGTVTANVRGSGVETIKDGKFTFANIEADDGGYRNVGIGGVCGYICTTGTATSTFGIAKSEVETSSYSDEMKQYFETFDGKSVMNKADVSGNMFIGGVVGNLYSENAYSSTRTDITMQNCHNDAQISVTKMPDEEQLKKMEEKDPSFETLSGLYVGGIIGYNYRARIAECSYDMSDESTIATYEDITVGTDSLKADREGIFVGGISGFSYDGTINDCKTNVGGYLLGYDYVGGIIGSTKASNGTVGGAGESKRSTDNNTLVSDNVNGSYIIGHSFVGGIIGMNTSGVTVLDTSNNGIAVGDGIDIGGIAGRNSGNDTKKAEIINCSAKLNDYGSALFDMVKNTWKFYGSNVGGQVGFNEYGLIEFNNDSNTTKAVSSIAVGENNVGGFVGYNGINGHINLVGKDDDYISGRVYGTGDCVGGFIGINLAPEAVSEQKIIISTISVEGNRMVGGVVGANVLNMTSVVSDSTFNITYNNRVSKIKGISMVGGLVGYNVLTSNSDILPASNVVDSTTFVGVDDDSWCSNIVASGDYGLIKSAGKLSIVSNKTFTIGNAANFSLVDYNNAEVYADTFGGGLVGMNDDNSRMIIVHARNKGQVKEISTGSKVDLSAMLSLDTSADYSGINSGIFGGIIGYATKYTVVDACDNQGSLQLKNGGYGGVVGLNEGYITNCFTSTNVGETTLSIIGGIAGINYTSLEGEYTIGSYSVKSGEIKDCYNGADMTVTGKNHVGGVTGINVGILNNCYALGYVRGKLNIGGITGVNLSTIETAGTLKIADSLEVVGNSNVGGLVGINDATSLYTGKILYTATGTSYGDKVVSVTAKNANAGGIVGYLKSGNIKGDTDNYIKSYAKVKADNYAGGIVGYMPANIPDVAITCSENDGEVIATNAYAGGIVSINDNNRITYSNNCGSVSSSYGYAGGIVSENINSGYINECRVYGQTDDISIRSTKEDGGAVCAINHVNSTILNCKVSSNNHYVSVDGSNLKNIGYITGKNLGTINGGQVYQKVSYVTSMTEINLGGIVGYNQAKAYVKNIGSAAAHSIEITNTGNIKYLGGVVGNNEGNVINSSFSGKILESQMTTTGHAYGGIVGINHIADEANKPEMTDNYINGATIDVVGMSAIDSAQTAEGKLRHTSFVGGIVGYNDEGVTIKKAYISSESKSTITANYGMLGGIAGANSGTIDYCGYSDSMELVDDVYDNLSVKRYGKTDGSDAGINRLNKIIGTNKKYESITATDESGDYDCVITMSANGDGYLGGITGFNAVNGRVTKCATGKWNIVSNNTTKTAQVAGIVAQNESDNDFSYNVNCAYVLRKVSSGNTKYYVGGIIGIMQNRTSNKWKIDSCVNIGTVVDHNSHNVGGI
nr:type II secretion system GspH family protein [Lachnospiraceae bacterium]